MSASVVRLGLVGLGLAGGVMAAAAQHHPGVRLVAAAEPDAGLRARFTAAEGLPAAPDIDGLLDRADVDAVYIATPHRLHRAHAVAAAEAGKHILVEKPMALTVDDCAVMVTAAAANGVELVVGHTHGFDPAVLLMRRLVEAGTYGEVGLVALWNYTDFLYRPRRPDELDSSRGGGILYNQVPHQVDVIRTIAGDARSVRAITAVLDPGRPTEGACTAVLELASGAGASLVYSGYDHFDSDELHEWVGEGGRPRSPAHGSARRALRGLDQAAEERARTDRLGYGSAPVAAPDHQPHFGELVVTLADADLRVGRDHVIAYTEHGIDRLAVPRHPWWPGRGDVLDELVGAVLDGRPAVHDGTFGLETVRTCLALATSARKGREVPVTTQEGDDVRR